MDSLPPRGGQAVSAADLQKRRDALARELAELQWDLGGLAYEMAIRDHFRLDLLVRQAGRLQEVDARLGEVEHLLRLDTTGAAGACPRCGTLYARGSLFCSHCALQLVQVQPAGAPAALPAPNAAPTERLPAAPSAAASNPAASSAAAPAPAAPGAPVGAPAAPDPRTGAPAPAAPDAPYGVHAPDERDATVAFERPAEEPTAR